jgi:dTDP-4-dehydrorhamnose 3,5-epimerase
MKLTINTSKIPDCYELQPAILKDERGSFVKTFHENVFKNYQLETHFPEEYYSVSVKNVLRGLHFQRPPQEHTKLVYCVQGQVLDVVLDLRLGSPTYGQFATFEVSAEKANLIYISTGLAHGFYVTSEQAIMIYKVSTVYSPNEDAGILWNSLSIPWGSDNPILSKRDQSFVAFSEFQTPFTYQEKKQF